MQVFQFAIKQIFAKPLRKKSLEEAQETKPETLSQLTQAAHPAHMKALWKLLFTECLLPATGVTIYLNCPPWEWRISINSSAPGSGKVGQHAELRAVPAFENLPFHLETFPKYYSASALLASVLFRIKTKVLPYILFFLYVFQITSTKSILVSAYI